MCQELEDIFGDSNRPVTFEDIQNLKYLDQVVHETWRLYPPIPLIAKQPTKDIELGKYSSQKWTEGRLTFKKITKFLNLQQLAMNALKTIQIRNT